MRKRANYSAEFKTKVVLELLQEGSTLSELSAKHGVSPVLLSRWKKEFLERADAVFKKGPSEAEEALEREKEYAEELEKKVGQLTHEFDFLKKKSDEALGPGWEERAGYKRRK